MRCFFIFFIASAILASPAAATANELSKKAKQQVVKDAKTKNGNDVAAQTAAPKKDQKQQTPPAITATKSKSKQHDNYITPVPKKHEITIGNELSDD